jgi:hypothetical protein
MPQSEQLAGMQLDMKFEKAHCLLQVAFSSSSFRRSVPKTDVIFPFEMSSGCH